MGPEIPEALKAVAADPYRAPAEPACQSIPAELAVLNDALGPDADEHVKEKSHAVANALSGAVRRMIPYRGVVRFLTGAGEKDKALRAAVMAGFARRGFLRGLEANLHCATEVAAATAEGADAAAIAPDPRPAEVAVSDPGPADKVAVAAPETDRR